MEEQSGMSSDVWSFDFDKILEGSGPKVKLLNSLNEARMKAACAILRNDDSKEMYVTVAGGFSGAGTSLASIEVLRVDLLDLDRSLYSKWETYPATSSLPFGLYGGALLSSPGTLTLLGGQNSAQGLLNTVIKGAADGGWEVVDNLKHRRADFAVVKLPST